MLDNKGNMRIRKSFCLEISKKQNRNETEKYSHLAKTRIFDSANS